MVIEVLAIRSLKSHDGRLQLLLELEENVPSEALAQLCELFHQGAIVRSQQNKNVDGHVLRALSERFDLLFERLLEVELLVVDDESLLNVSLLFR